MEWHVWRRAALSCLAVIGLAGAQETISGTVFAPVGGDVYGTYVIACYPDANEDCDESLTKFVQISQGGLSAPFEIRNLHAAAYAVLAWQDSNGNGEIDDGEPITFYRGAGAEPAMLTAPAQGISLRFGATELEEATRDPVAPHGGNVAFAPEPAEAGVVKGTVLDGQGRPIAGARIEIRNAANVYASNLVITTGQDGRYRFDLPPGGAWNAYGDHELVYNGWRYCLRLAPQSWDAFSSVSGAVRNFSMKISGPGRYSDGSGFWGGRIDIDADFNGRPSVNGHDTLRFTLVPQGPLLDGSTGQTIKLEASEARQSILTTDLTSTYYIYDVPLGRYLLTIDYVEASGALSPLWLRLGYGGETARALPVDFQEGTDCGSTPYLMVSARQAQ